MEPSRGNPEASALIRADLSDHFRLLRCQLRRYFIEKGHRLLHGNTGVATEEIAATLELPPQPGGATLSSLLSLPAPDEVASEAAVVRARLESRRLSCQADGRDLPFDTLRASFRLSNVEIAFLAAQLAAQVDLDLQRLLRLAWADFAQKQPTAGFLIELVSDTRDEREALLLALRPHGQLVHHGLIALVAPDGWRGEAPLQQCFTVMPNRVTQFLQLGAVAEPVAGQAAWHLEPPDDPTVGETTSPIGTVVRGAVEATLASRPSPGEEPPRLLLCGLTGSGRLSLIRELASAEGRPLVVIQLDRILNREASDAGPAPLADPEGRLRSLGEALRDAVLHKALVMVQDAQLLDDSSPAQAWVIREVLDRLSEHPQRLVLSAPAPVIRLRQRLRTLVEVEVPPATPVEQSAVWRRSLSGDMAENAIEPLISMLTQQHSLTPGDIHRAVSQAKAQARSRPRGQSRRLRPDDVLLAVRRHLHHQLGHLAQNLRTPLTWDALILPPRLLAKLREIIARMKHRQRVLDEWGFRQKLSRGRGLSCLFAGPPGTGKTMAAELVAKEQGREVFRVDLSRVVDKYIGETEKNLGRLFDEAERAQSVLLFDEADSLFAKRTKVSSSNDRYANLEVNFLLQRIESFEGVCILTTNFEAAIDDAFKRRLAFRLSFPMPTVTERARMWCGMLPEQADQEDDIDWNLLAENFAFSGGHIKNAVIRAAYESAERAEPIGLDGLYRAAVEESLEMGQLVRDVPLDAIQEQRKKGPSNTSRLLA